MGKVYSNTLAFIEIYKLIPNPPPPNHLRELFSEGYVLKYA